MRFVRYALPMWGGRVAENAVPVRQQPSVDLGAPLEPGIPKTRWLVPEAMPDGGRILRQTLPAPHRARRADKLPTQGTS